MISTQIQNSNKKETIISTSCNNNIDDLTEPPKMMLGRRKQPIAEAVSDLFMQNPPIFHVNIQEESIMLKCAPIVSK